MHADGFLSDYDNFLLFNPICYFISFSLFLPIFLRKFVHENNLFHKRLTFTKELVNQKSCLFKILRYKDEETSQSL